MLSRKSTVLTVILLSTVLALALGGCSSSEPTVVDDAPVATSEPTVTPKPDRLEDIEISVERIAEGFDQPLLVTSAGDGSGRLFVVEKTGKIRIIGRDGTVSDTVFLDLSGAVSTASEQGALGLAFSPDYAEDGTFYVNYTESGGASIVSRFRVSEDPDVADAASQDVLLRVAQPYANHNGGNIAFGPDGYLYIGFGDGGSGGDPDGNGQDPSTLLGSMLRIDVSESAEEPYGVPDDNPFVDEAGGPRPEVWAYGLRNPWRFSFDRKTGDLWIGDVGQNAWEEIDFQPANSNGGENYGWNVLEGTHAYPEDADPPTDIERFTPPVVEYDHAAGRSVTGGYVYRGGDPGLQGIYFYADFTSGRIWGLSLDADNVRTSELLSSGLQVASFGESDEGELYVVDFRGGVYRLTAK